MATRPGDVPEWSSQSTAEVTTPTTLIREEGWDPAVLPQAQHDNWFKRTAYLWIIYFLQMIDGLVGLLFADQATDLGVAPVTGSTLTLAPGDFSGAIIQGGNFIGVTPSPAVTLDATRRHYWDLSDAGVWTRTTTLLGDGPPAVAAGRKRVYIFTTDATGIDAIEYQAPAARARFRGGVSLGESVPYGTPITQVPAGLADGTYQYILQSTVGETSIYISSDVLGLGPGVAVVTNAVWDQDGGVWTRDDPAEPALIRVFARYFGAWFGIATVAAAGATWDDAIGAADWVFTAQIDETAGFIDAAARMTAPQVDATTKLVTPLIEGDVATFTGALTVEGYINAIGLLLTGAGTIDAAGTATIGGNVIAVGSVSGLHWSGPVKPSANVGTPDSNTLYRGNVVKAVAAFDVDSSGVVTLLDSCFNVADVTNTAGSASLNTMTEFRINFDRDFNSDEFAISGEWCGRTNGGWLRTIVNEFARTSARFDGSLAHIDTPAVAIVFGAAGASYRINLTFMGPQ